MRISSLNNEIPALKSDHDEDRLVRYSSQLISRHHTMLRQFATAATTLLLCLLPPFCGSFPMCTDGQTPLMEVNDAFPCSRGCPKGFFCEYQDSRQNPVLGICCANRTELQLLYGSNDKQVDPIWKGENSAEHKSPAQAVEAFSLTQAPGTLFVHTRTIDDNESNEALARNQHRVKKSDNSIHITVTDNVPAADDPLADEVIVDSDKSLGPSIESRLIEEFFPRDDDGLYAEVLAFNASEIFLNGEDDNSTSSEIAKFLNGEDSNSTSPELAKANSTSVVTIKALSAGKKQHAKKSNLKNSEEEVVVLSSEAKDSKEENRNWEKDDSEEKLTAPKGVFQVLSKKDDLSKDITSSELANSADKSSDQGTINVNIKNVDEKEEQPAPGGDHPKDEKESEEGEDKRQYSKGEKGSEEGEDKRQYSCERQNYELTCNGTETTTQPKIRWFLNDNGECEHYPWGYCPGDRVVNSTTIRTKEECLRECLGYTAEQIENVKDAKLKDDIPNPTEIPFQEEPLEQLHDLGDKVVSEKSPVTNPPVTAETPTCETSTVEQRDEENSGIHGKEENGRIDEKNSTTGSLGNATLDQNDKAGGKLEYEELALCTATSYRYVCKSGLRTQFVYRWSKVDGKCLSFPYGYCVYEFNHPHPRTREECEKYC
ncbi:unnamed protein product [Cylicocyclus nassatus]|uniref:BPTI/Kunitz inhibitor domain-containing protein n=1 Tax=Cylicocyclus nassatus TaxID=53992 RepID=A0AA36DJH4_CYLNA|nr:unnamed protein product [Cylicocyclus nassatus]